jgi:hypothetical protein
MRALWRCSSVRSTPRHPHEDGVWWGWARARGARGHVPGSSRRRLRHSDDRPVSPAVGSARARPIRYYHPVGFALKQIALELGFVTSVGPLVRSSYHAHETAGATGTRGRTLIALASSCDPRCDVVAAGRGPQRTRLAQTAAGLASATVSAVSIDDGASASIAARLVIV